MSNLDPAAFPRSPKDLARWQKWVEDRLKYLGSARALIERGSVAGGVVTVRELLTNPTAVIAFRNVDTADAARPGDQSIYLTYVPIEGSEHVYWNGLEQPPTQWTRNKNVVQLADSEHFVLAGDEFSVAYSYDPAQPAWVNWESPGWRYLVVAETDTTDRSAPGFDDSAWTAGRGAFGNVIAEDGTKFSLAPASWHPPHTVFDPPTDIGVWIRRPLPTIPISASPQVSVRVDGDASIYWNGTLVATRSADGTTDVDPITIDSSLLGGQNVLAIHLVDDTPDPPSDFLYLDARVEW